MIAALFVQTNGRYFGMPDVDPWDVKRDARLYSDDYAIVAHPPCQLWVNLAAVNWKRYQRERPAWYLGGHDYGCFASALRNVRRCGGVIEHPASSHAWLTYDLERPSLGWTCTRGNEWVCEVWQSAHGHKARKRTWLFYVGARRPFDLNWARIDGTHQIGNFLPHKPVLTGHAASATPPAFADCLITLARWSRAI